MAVAMTIEIGAMTGLAAGSRDHVGRTTSRSTGAGAVTRLTREVGRMVLDAGHIGGRGGGMTVDAHGHRWHGMEMTMTIKVGTVTGIAVRVV